jgi:hypothetical protein
MRWASSGDRIYYRLERANVKLLGYLNDQAAGIALARS